MVSVFILLTLISVTMFVVSLIAPRVGLFFAAPTRKTRPWGLAFWSLATFAFFLLFGVETDRAKDGAHPALLVITALFVIGCIVMAVKLRQGRVPEKAAPTAKPAVAQAPSPVPQAATEVASQAPTSQPPEPQTQARQTLVTITSHTEAGTEYTLDIAALSCTCPDWLDTRANQASGSPARLCKHLAEYLGRRPVEMPPTLRLYQAIIKQRGDAGRGLPIARAGNVVEYGEVKGKGYVMEIEARSYPWANLIIGGVRYGYNLDEKRWARGEKPKEATALAEKAKTLAGEA